MLPLLNRIKTWWTEADVKQRAVTLGGIGALLLLLVATVVFATRPRYTVLLENLREKEQSDVVDALKAMNIPVQYSRRGVVEVPESQADEARMGLAKTGNLPSGPNHLSFPDLAKIGPMVSPGVEAQAINKVLEGEIASTLETMEGVAAARVLITQPRETVFQDEKEAPTASVTLTEKGDGSLTAANGRMIANLVCSAVQGMKPEGVNVVTSGLGVLWDGKNGGMPVFKGELDAKTSRYWEGKIQGALDDFAGPHNTRVIVNANVDTSKKSTRITEETPTTDPTESKKVSEKMAKAKGSAGGITGAVSNGVGGKAPAVPPADGKAPETYEKKGEEKKFGNNETITTIDDGSGGLRALAITVAVNSKKVKDVAGVEAIVRGVMASDIETDAAGVAKPNQKFAVNVRPFEFDESGALAAKEAEDKRAGAARTGQILSFLPILAVLAVALFVAKGIAKIVRGMVPAPVEEEPLAEGALALPEGPEGGDGRPAAVHREQRRDARAGAHQAARGPPPRQPEADGARAARHGGDPDQEHDAGGEGVKKKDEGTSNRQKAAILLMTLGPDLAGNVVRHLEEEHTEQLTLELARLDKVTPAQQAEVVTEFYQSAMAQEFIVEGGINHARQMLESAYGAERAEEIIKRIVAAMQVVPFEFLKRADPAQVLSFIQDEHPQTIALILAYMPVVGAAAILGKLPAPRCGRRSRAASR